VSSQTGDQIMLVKQITAAIEIIENSQMDAGQIADASKTQSFKFAWMTNYHGFGKEDKIARLVLMHDYTDRLVKLAQIFGCDPSAYVTREARAEELHGDNDEAYDKYLAPAKRKLIKDVSNAAAAILKGQ
jgi:hypothetical protein